MHCRCIFQLVVVGEIAVVVDDVFVVVILLVADAVLLHPHRSAATSAGCSGFDLAVTFGFCAYSAGSVFRIVVLLHPFVFRPSVLKPNLHLCFGEVERLRQLFAFGSDHVVVLLEGVFQLQQLTGTESRSHSLRLAEWRQQETCQIRTWRETVRSGSSCSEDALLLLTRLRQEPPLLRQRIRRPSGSGSASACAATDSGGTEDARKMTYRSGHGEQRLRRIALVRMTELRMTLRLLRLEERRRSHRRIGLSVKTAEIGQRGHLQVGRSCRRETVGMS